MTTLTVPDARTANLGPDVLVKAGILLSATVGPNPHMLTRKTLHKAISAAVQSLRPGSTWDTTEALADEALAMFVEFLDLMHELDRHLPHGDQLSVWVYGRRVQAVSWTLLAAAERWRYELLAARVAGVVPGGGW
ncbi:MAG: hypothetical protein HOV87_12250 [Catenulispora sp.]|nr:hypothetical protein [Catenulispora sp.]NUT39981.1 hypothetical protein [Thermoactinospora sp.]